MNRKWNLDGIRLCVQQSIEKRSSLFQSMSLHQLTIASAAFGVLAIFFYFFSTYFPLLYLFAVLFLFLKLAAFELTLSREKKNPEQSNPEIALINQALFEITDILLWITIILADSHYYAIGIFVLAIYWGTYFFETLSLRGKIPTPWVNHFTSIHRTLFLLPVSLVQLVAQKAQWKIDVFYWTFCLIILAGIVSIIHGAYQLYQADASHPENE